MEHPFDDRADAALLSRLGYAQELFRAMGGFSSFAISFSVISILTGAITLFSHGLSYAGPAAMGLGWPLVTVGTAFVAIAMAELASAFPTAGALYHWSALLGGAAAGWFTAWLNLVGQFAITAGIDYGFAKFLGAALGLGDRWFMVLFGATLAIHAGLNHLGVRLVAWLNDASAIVHIVGVAALVVALIGFGRSQPLSFLLERTPSVQGGPYSLLFCVALLQAMWTFTGYDASAHVSEETHDPSRRAPWGLVLSVAVSGVAGYLLVCSLTLAIRPGELGTIAADETAPLAIVRHALGDTAGRVVIGLAIVAMWFCGLSSVTANSRMIYAFARDGGLPGSAIWRHVSPKFQTPAPAIWLSAAVAFALVAAARAVSPRAYDAVTALSTVSLYLSYGVPIALGLASRLGRRWTVLGPWNAGRAGLPISIIATAWIVFASVLCVIPPNALVGVTLGAIGAGLMVAYVLVVRGRFRGPSISLSKFQADSARRL
jgi:amino acid transporter